MLRSSPSLRPPLYPSYLGQMGLETKAETEGTGIKGCQYRGTWWWLRRGRERERERERERREENEAQTPKGDGDGEGGALKAHACYP